MMKLFLKFFDWLTAISLVIILFGAIIFPHVLQSTIVFPQGLQVNLQSNYQLLFYPLILAVFIFLFVVWKTKGNELMQRILMWVKFRIRPIVLIAVAAMIVYQLIMLTNGVSVLKADVGGVHDAALMLPHGDYSYYLSKFPNNLPLFYWFYFLSHWLVVLPTSIANEGQWYVEVAFNILFIDGTLMFSSLAAHKLIGKNVGYVVMIVGVLFYGMSPFVIIPYTDTMVTFFVSLAFFMLVLVMKKFEMSLKNIVLLLVFAVSVGLAFIIKPSSVIPFMALVIIGVAYLVMYFSKRNLVKLLVVLFVMVMGIAGLQKGLSEFNQHQQIVRLEVKDKMPFNFWIYIGLYDEPLKKGNITDFLGGHNSPDDRAMVEVPEKDRAQFGWTEIRNRLRKFGVVGFVKFLVKKNFVNTADGSFAWGISGTAIPKQDNLNKLTKYIQMFVWPYGAQQKYRQTYFQVIWVFVLLMMIMSFADGSFAIRVLRLSFLGGMMFLLMFEGGRSRYLIQFMPLYLPLVAIGIKNFLAQQNNKVIYHGKSESNRHN
ncbi:hypothetical protein EQG49_03590 [Periweissella cryptocerci]|uniref:Glycosyltransferase RgtA/B/C/D-like domain-containing protein n=1 Tax=Periweissella cryptocerci TaxID=2506420 RepID=A0A4V1AII3_9LACO|nr:hypothetical protein [Periweissella cryptocerci]QBO35605.1 hypothetical protein EQG49_03590 [Periweissella cryptocerci]